MKTGLLVIFGLVLAVLISFVLAQPSFNGNAPGCSGTGCHTFNDNDVSATLSGNLEVEVTLTGVQSGSAVAGELVDMNGTVVDVVNSTHNNPFTLTAPSPGRYLINAGYKNPSRRWDSVSVDISLTSIKASPKLKGSLKSFELYQNHPNPFNPTTVIRYRIPKTSDVAIEVFDLSGRKIATLTDARKPAGDYTVNFDGSNLASGVYLYRIQAGDYIDVKRMILLR